MGQNSAFYGNLSCAAARPTRRNLHPKISCIEFGAMKECLQFSRENADDWPNLVCSDIDVYGGNGEQNEEEDENGSGVLNLNLASFQILTGIGWVPARAEDYRRRLNI